MAYQPPVIRFGCHIFRLAPISNNAPHWIHSNPELAFEEHQACNNIVSLLKNRGFTVISPAYDPATSFESTYSFGGRLVVFNAEYDTQPGICHACGYNLGTASVVVFLAVAHYIRHSYKPSRV